MDKNDLLNRLRLPLMAAPMSIASTPALVEACCQAGIVGCFPTHNAWKDAGLQVWVDRVAATLERVSGAGGRRPAPFAVNINVSRAKPTEVLQDEIDICRRRGVQIITTNVGNPCQGCRVRFMIGVGWSSTTRSPWLRPNARWMRAWTD